VATATGDNRPGTDSDHRGLARRAGHSRGTSRARESSRRRRADHPEIQQRQGETAIPTSEGGDEQGDRRYYESVLDVGDEVCVSGYARRSDGVDDETGSDDEVTLGAPPSGERGSFLLSDEPRQSVARRRRFQSVVALAVGLLLVWYGLSQFVPGVPFVRLGP
jgi:hypothetical protein